MKTSLMLLSSTVVFALLTITFGHNLLLSNYQYWTCWNSCIWDTFEECSDMCNDEPTQESIPETREDRKKKSQKLRDMYQPIIYDHADNIKSNGWMFNRGYGYSHPDSLEDNLTLRFEYSDGFFMHLQVLDVVSPLNVENPGKITLVKEMLFPEVHLFWAFILGIGVIMGIKTRK